MKRSLIFLATCLLTAGLLVAGCGNDDDDGGDALSHEELITQGNEICSEGNDEVDAAAEELFSNTEQPTEEQAEAFVNDTLVPSIQGQIDDLRDLEGPSEDEDALNPILDEAETVLGELEADPALVEQDTFGSVNQQLDDFGLTECAG